jgi:ketosteroid isomerase-like protein
MAAMSVGCRRGRRERLSPPHAARAGRRDVSTVLTSELAYTVEIERIRTRVGDSDGLTRIAIRTTTVFRSEGGTWKVTHRHGDPITSMRPAESVLQS